MTKRSGVDVTVQAATTRKSDVRGASDTDIVPGRRRSIVRQVWRLARSRDTHSVGSSRKDREKQRDKERQREKGKERAKEKERSQNGEHRKKRAGSAEQHMDTEVQKPDKWDTSSSSSPFSSSLLLCCLHRLPSSVKVEDEGAAPVVKSTGDAISLSVEETK